MQKKIICENKNHQKYLIARHLQPSPRVDLGMELVKKNLSKSAIDISDGLLADLLHICQTSNLDAVIQQDLIPISKAAEICLLKNKNINLSQLISGGDDYELLFAIKPRDQKKLFDLAKSLKLNLSCIGSFKKPANKNFAITLRDEENKKITIKKFGYEHF